MYDPGTGLSPALDAVHQRAGGVCEGQLVPRDARREIVEREDRGDGDAESERGFNERFRDTGGDRGETARACRRDSLKRRDDSQHGPEEPDEGT